MTRSPFLGAVALPLVLFLAAPSPGLAQSIRGQVVLSGWREPVPSARVQLLGADMTPVSDTETDATGQYRFPTLDPGRYFLQAIHGQHFSSLEGPFEIDGTDAARADLIMRSELFDRAVGCLAEGRAPDQGVLAGVAYDAGTDTPLPGARVVVEWSGEQGSGARVRGEADGAGRFVLCQVPAAVGLTVWVESLGRTSERQREVRVEPGSVARLDIPLYLGSASSLRVLEALPGALRTEHAAVVEGRLLDAETGTPIGGAEVRLSPQDLRAITDAAGRFRFARVAPGATSLAVRRLGYEWESGPVEIAEAASMLLELRAAPQAVELDAVVVRASTAEARMARAATQAPRVFAGAYLRLAEERTAQISEVIRQFPSLSIKEGRFETSDGVEYGLCVESSRALHRYAVLEKQTLLPWCESIAVVVDGVTAIRGLEQLITLPLWEVESIEFLPPLGALRWGQRAAVNGALVIWTRGRGPHRDPERN
jgi:hypothetical protein